MLEEKTKKVKPVEEMTITEVLDRLTEITKTKILADQMITESEALALRIDQLYVPLEDMDIEQLKLEVSRLDSFKCDVIKPFYKRRQQVFNMLQSMTGPGFDWESDESIDPGDGLHWQDEKGIVWATERVTGTFVEFNDFGVTRTRDLDRGETKGLSMTKARKLGYVVEGK